MAVLDGAYPPLLGGVTQQHPGMAPANQVALQENMVSDPVTGLRRRPGFRLDHFLSPSNGGSSGQYPETGSVDNRGHPKLRFKCELGGYTLHISICPRTGDICAYKEGANGSFTFWSAGQYDYLIADHPSDLSWACLQDELFVLNRLNNVPSLTNYLSPGAWGENAAGFCWIKAGQFSKSYKIEVNTPRGDWFWLYVTPTGTNAGDADKATPGAIADFLAESINVGTSSHQLQAWSANGVVFIKTLIPVSYFKIYTGAGAAYASASGGGNVAAVTDLPPKLGQEQQGFRCSVGTNSTALSYYYWDWTSGLWLECAGPGRLSTLEGMPIALVATTTGLVNSTTKWPLALAGDANTNPYPAFTDDTGITGISTFQGRLVLLSGSYVCLSSSTNPRMFMRTTVQSLLDSDAIEVASGSVNNAVYKHAVQYNRDLILFADGQISVIPGSGVLTPKTAQVVPSNTTSMLTTVPPVQAGNMVMFPVPGADASGRYSGFDALYPSQYTSSQYAIEQLTDHLPQYLPGAPSQIASSGNCGFVAVLYENNPTSVYIYQYIWKQQELALNAWHQWVLPGMVTSIYIAEDRLYAGIKLMDGVQAHEVIGSVSLTQYNGADLSNMAPFLDMYTVRGPGTTLLTPPESLLVHDVAVQTPSEYAGERMRASLGYAVTGEYQIVPDSSFPSNATYAVGIPYTSKVTLNAPSLRDANGHPYLQNRVFWVNLRMNIQNTGNYNMTYQYRGDSSTLTTIPINPVDWSSPAVAPGKAKVLDSGAINIPVSGEVNYAAVSFYANGYHDMNFTGIEYTIKTEKQRRRI